MSGEGPFLSRWSKRKLQARKGESVPAEPASPPPSPAPVAMPPAEAEAEEPLPPVESLTPESDFTPFMKPEVDGSVRNQALKALFRDPQFNVMDGLDVYIDDYSKPDPLPEGWLERMNQVARLVVCDPDPAEEPPKAPAEAAPAAEAPEAAAPPGDRPDEDRPESETG